MSNDVKLFKCDVCNCTQLFTINPHQFEEKDVTNWNTFGLKAYAGVAPILVCLNCFKIHVPPANMSGKSMLDVNVRAYGDMMEWVKKHNSRFSEDKFKSLEDKVMSMYVDMYEPFGHGLCNRVDILESKGCKCTKEETYIYVLEGESELKGELLDKIDVITDPTQKTKTRVSKKKVA